jgi:hypothetical protein
MQDMCLGESSQFVYFTSVSVIIIKTQNRQEKNQSKTAQTQHPSRGGAPTRFFLPYPEKSAFDFFGYNISFKCELRVELNHKKSMTYKNAFQISDFINLCSFFIFH